MFNYFVRNYKKTMIIWCKFVYHCQTKIPGVNLFSFIFINFNRKISYYQR